MHYERHKSRYLHTSKPLTKQEGFRRFELFDYLQTYFYPWIKQTGIQDNTERYPNQMIQDLNYQLTFFVEDPFKDDWELRRLHDEITRLCHEAESNYYAQQAKAAELAQQQQNYSSGSVTYNYNNPNAYAQQTNYSQQQQQSNYVQQQQQSNYVQQQQQPNYSQQQPNYGQQVNYGQQGGYGQQGYGQGYNNSNQQHHSRPDRRNQDSGNYRQTQRNYQEGTEGRQYNNRSGGERGEYGYKKNNFYQKGHSHHHNHHQAPYLPEKKFLEDDVQQTQEQYIEEVVVKQQPVIQAPPPPPPPPPKPEPKPTKFSISQIKDFINAFSKQELEKHVNPEIIEKVKEISEWKSEEVQIEFKDDGKNQKKEYKKQQQQYQGGKPVNIKTGVRRDQAKEAERMGYKGQGGENKVTIVVGAKETLETRQMKEELKKKATDFVGQKLQEEKNLDPVEKDRRQIVFNLNLIVPENLRDIQKDLVQYLYSSESACQILVNETIKKAWDQPKYASTYAKLCADFSKKAYTEFKFEKDSKKEKKDNPFKLYLVDSVQHSFDQKIDKFPAFQSAEDKDLFLKDFKKKILSNVKFIAQLIICKVLKKRIIKYCISQLLQSFFKHYYAFTHEKKIEDSVYDYHYEAIIEFIENIGQKYDSIDEKEKQKEKEQKIPYNFIQIKDHIQKILKGNILPNKELIDATGSFTGDQYFELLEFIDSIFIKSKFSRLSALLQNLIERRNNKWAKHLSVAEGPKKLKDIQEDIQQQEDQGKKKQNKEEAELQKLDKKVKEMFQGWQMGKNEEQRQMKDILRKHNESTFYFSLLKQVADGKKEIVAKRVNLFPVIMDYERFKMQAFKSAWGEGIKYLAIGGQDFPFCGAAMAKILALAVERGAKLTDFHKNYEEEEQMFFSEEVVHKYHYYTKDQAALKIIKPKAKYSGLI